MPCAAQVCGIYDPSGGAELCDEGIAARRARATATPRLRLEGVRRGEVGGCSAPGYVGVSAAVRCDGQTELVPGTPYVGRINQHGAGGVELRREGVTAGTAFASERRLRAID